MIFGVYPKQEIQAIKYFFTRHISQIRAGMQGEPFLACPVSFETVEQILIQSTAMATGYYNKESFEITRVGV